MRVHALLAAVAAGALLGLACSERQPQLCRIEREYEVLRADSDVDSIDAIAAPGGGAILFFGTNGGVAVQRLDRDGRPVGRPDALLTSDPRKVDKTWWRDEAHTVIAHVDATPARDGALICAIRHTTGRPNTAFALHWSQEAVHRVALPQLTGADSISCTPQKTPLNSTFAAAAHVLHDGRPLVRVIRVRRGRVVAERTFRGTEAALDPHLLALPGDRMLLSLTTVAPGNLTIHTYVLDDTLSIRGQHRIASVNVVRAHPTAVSTPKGLFMLYEDDRDTDGRSEVYAVPLHAAGGPRQPPTRISRADGPGGPAASGTAHELYVAAIRSYGHTLLVGLNRLDYSLAKKSGEFQIYADKSAFVATAVTPLHRGIAVAYVEEMKRGSRVLVGVVRCR